MENSGQRNGDAVKKSVVEVKDVLAPIGSTILVAIVAFVGKKSNNYFARGFPNVHEHPGLV